MANYKSSTDEGKSIFCEIIKCNIQTPEIFGKIMSLWHFYPHDQVSKLLPL